MRREADASCLLISRHYRKSEVERMTPRAPMCEERARRPNNAAPNERSGLSEWSGGWIAGGFVTLAATAGLVRQRRRSKRSKTASAARCRCSLARKEFMRRTNFGKMKTAGQTRFNPSAAKLLFVHATATARIAQSLQKVPRRVSILAGVFALPELEKCVLRHL